MCHRNQCCQNSPNDASSSPSVSSLRQTTLLSKSDISAKTFSKLKNLLAAMETEIEMLNTYFSNGAQVEISSDEDGFRGAWYEGTVIRPIHKKQRRNIEDDDDEESGNKLRVLVEYKTLMADKKGKRPLKEEMTLVQLRPRPPPERQRKFNVSEEVDAYYNDGWWEGVVMEVTSDGKYSVFFRGTMEQLEFEESQIRIHREWANGEWTPPFEEEEKEKLVCTEMKPNNQAAEIFSEGSLVEVSSDEEGFEGAWFVATVVKLLDNGNYLIEYQNLRNNDDTEFLQEETDRWHIRPRPPDIGPFESFKVLEEVDALHNDGWWVGVISKVLKGLRYKVYFKANNEELEFKHSDIRLHLDWTNGNWVRASRALKL